MFVNRFRQDIERRLDALDPAHSAIEPSMALLQISEPGQAPDPHQRRVAVGIDLGTTHSLVAAVRHGVAECLPDDQGRVLLPSAVRYLDGGRRQIGYDALDAMADDAENTIVSVKRFMGRRLADIAGRDKLPYRFVDQPGMVALATRDGRQDAGRGVGRDPGRACASAPRTPSTPSSSAPSSPCRRISTTRSARRRRTPRSWPA